MENTKFIVVDQRVGNYLHADRVSLDNINHISILAGRRVFSGENRIKTYKISNFFRKILFMKTKKVRRSPSYWLGPRINIVYVNDHKQYTFDTYSSAKTAYDSIRKSMDEK